MSSLAEAREAIGALLDSFAARNPRMGVAAEEKGGAGVPPDMQIGEVDEEGWVAWRVMASRVTEADLDAWEDHIGVSLPMWFRAYLGARAHIYDQLHAMSHKKQLIFMPATPTHDPLSEIRGLVEAWRPLLEAGYLPVAQWGDGWGPMCLDLRAGRPDEDDFPIVWFDHEILGPLGPDTCRDRDAIAGHGEPLYASYRDFIHDVFPGVTPG